VASDAAGNLYIADESTNTVRKVNTSGIITTIAGIGNQLGASGDGGPATAAELDSPQGVGVDSHGNVYIADWSNAKIRKVDKAGIITTYAGSTPGFGGDGGPATAANLSIVSNVAADSSGNIYIADENNCRVRKVNSAGIISTFAGTGVNSYSGDSGPATAAEISKITGVAVDDSNNVYIADVGNNRIRMVNKAGIITTIAGNGSSGYNGDGGQATAAEINAPNNIWKDATGSIYIADYGNDVVRMINTSGIISTIAGSGQTGYSGDGGPATAAELNSPTGISSDGKGNVYIGDVMNNRVRVITVPITTAVQNNNPIVSAIVVYPNPNNGVFTFSITNNKSVIANVRIYNVLGEEKYAARQTLNNQGNFQMNMSKEPDGIYLYKVLDENGKLIGSGRFVKE